MKRMMIAGFAGGAAMVIGGALGAVSNQAIFPLEQPNPIVDSVGGVMNPMIAGQAMLPNRNLLENIAASPEHTTLVAALRESGIADALKSSGQFTVFAPTNAALSTLSARALEQDKTQLARMMGYLVVPGRYDSQALLRVISEGGGQAKLRTVEGGVLVARMNGPTNVILMDENGATADIAIYDVYDKNGVMHVIDHMLEPGMAARQVASR
ncbi:MAG: fasciclin domain-containing protein [Rhizomicrobium sp.]